MILEKFSRISKFRGQITVRKLDSFLKTTSFSHKVYNPNCFCKKQFVSDSYNQTRYLNALSHVNYMHAEAEASVKNNVFFEYAQVSSQFLESHEIYANSVPKSLKFNESLAIDNVEEILGRSWISMSNSEIIKNFEHLSHYAFKHQAKIDDENFRGVLEVVKTRCSDFSDSDIRHVFKCLQLWKFEKDEHVFTEFWKTLEAEIMQRFSSWTIDETLLTAHLYYKLRLSRKSEFTWHSLRKIGRKPQNMNRTQLIHFTFLMKMNRRLPINLYNIEYYTEQQADKLSVFELGIFANTFHYYETPIRSPVFLEKFIDKLIAEVDTVNDMTLNSILKVLRVHRTTKEKHMNLLKELERVFPRLSLNSLTVVTFSVKKSLTHSESLMSKILERFESEMKKVRIRQMEQLIFALFTFGYDTKATLYCSAVMHELLDSSRITEIEKFPKVLVNITHYTLSMNCFSSEIEEICKKIFDPAFVDKLCNNDYYFLNREYLEMSYCLELDHPEYNGPKLEKQIIDYLCKTFGSYKNNKTIHRTEKGSLDGKLLSNIEQFCQKIFKSESAFYREAVLPHFVKAFGIICYDPETKEFGSPEEKLSAIPWNLPKYAPADGRKWFALVTASVTQCINNTGKPVGRILMQMRHLEKIGYEPIFIPHYEWENLPNDWAKENYILNILHR